MFKILSTVTFSSLFAKFLNPLKINNQLEAHKKLNSIREISKGVDYAQKLSCFLFFKIFSFQHN